MIQVLFSNCFELWLSKPFIKNYFFFQKNPAKFKIDLLRKVKIDRVGALLPVDYRIKATELMVRDLRLKLFTAFNLGEVPPNLFEFGAI